MATGSASCTNLICPTFTRREDGGSAQGRVQARECHRRLIRDEYRTTINVDEGIVARGACGRGTCSAARLGLGGICRTSRSTRAARTDRSRSQLSSSRRRGWKYGFETCELVSLLARRDGHSCPGYRSKMGVWRSPCFFKSADPSGGFVVTRLRMSFMVLPSIEPRALYIELVRSCST